MMTLASLRVTGVLGETETPRRRLIGCELVGGLASHLSYLDQRDGFA